jgi:hypothetical protein
MQRLAQMESPPVCKITKNLLHSHWKSYSTSLFTLERHPQTGKQRTSRPYSRRESKETQATIDQYL